MRAFVAAAVVALALASVSDEEVEQCVAECQQMQDTGLHCQSHYGDRRPHPLLVTVCTSGWKQGSLLGCRRACARESCFGLSVNQALLSKRDVACKSYEGQMPRPTVLETCREGFMLGAESRCHEVESELARAHAEEMAEVSFRRVSKLPDDCLCLSRQDSRLRASLASLLSCFAWDAVQRATAQLPTALYPCCFSSTTYSCFFHCAPRPRDGILRQPF